MTLKYFLAKIPLVTKFLMLGVKMTKEENQYYLVKRRGIYTVIPIEWREVFRLKHPGKNEYLYYIRMFFVSYIWRRRMIPRKSYCNFLSIRGVFGICMG